MSDAIAILIVDDHPLVREGLRAVMGLEPDLRIVGEATDGIEAVEMARRLRPSVILMDVLMPKMDGVAATAEILDEDRDARVLVLTSVTDLERIRPTIDAGALGYVTKNAPPAELLQAIRTIHQGGVHLPANMAHRLIGAAADPPCPPLAAGPLTERELEILRLVACGLGNDQIARRLLISPRTAGAHISHILDKLGLENRTQAALYAVRCGLAGLG